MKILTKFKAFAVVATIGLLVLTTLPASAQSNGLGITPKLSYTLAAGRQQTDSLFVKNLSTSQPLHVGIRVLDFRSQDETGTPVLLKNANEPLTPWSLKPYITITEATSIEPGKSKMIPFTLKLPANLGAGSYYSAIEYTALTDPKQQRVNVAASSATLMFVNVPGDVSQLLSILQFGPTKGGNFGAVFTKEAPTSFAYRVKNDGNVSETPSGSIVVKNMFGRLVANIDNANPRSELALIGQTRRVDVCNPRSKEPDKLPQSDNCQPLKLFPGRYTSELVLLYGQNGQPSRQISATASFWYLPLWFLAVLVVALSAIGLGGYWLYKKISSPRHKRSKH